MVKQLKNRYSDPTRNKRFMVGVDRAKMRLYDLDSSAQEENIHDSGQDDEQYLIVVLLAVEKTCLYKSINKSMSKILLGLLIGCGVIGYFYYTDTQA